MAFSATHPWLIVSLVLAVSLAAWLQLGRLEVHITAEELMAAHHPAKRLYDETQATFGSDDVTVVYLQDPQLFDRERLVAIREAVHRLEALPFVHRTESLFSVQNLRTVDGFLRKDPYLQELPKTREAAEALREAALRNSFVRDNLLSQDGTAMTISVYVADRHNEAGYDSQVARGIEGAIAPLSGRLAQVFQMGLPYVRDTISARIQGDQRRILPISIGVLLLTLMVTLRRLDGALIPLVTAGFSVLWTLGFMGLMGIPVNVLTSLVPALIIIIGSTEDIHLLSEYYHARQSGRNRVEAVHVMASRMGQVVLLTFATSFVGFLSIMANDIQLLYQFGLVAAAGLALNFLVTVLLVPIYLRYLGGRPPAERRDNRLSDSLTSRLVCYLLRRHRTKVIVIVVAVTVIVGMGASGLRINNNVMDYFEDSSPVKVRLGELTQRLAGIETLSIVVRSGIEGTFLKARYLGDLKKIQDYIAKDGRLDTTVSFADYIALLNSAMDESDEVYLPGTDDIVNELMLFLQHKDVKDYVTEDYATARILVRHHIESSYALNQVLRDLQAFMDAHVDPGLSVAITGQSVLTNQAVDAMATGQAKSILVMLVLIFVIISVLFVNPFAGLVAIIPNVLPIILLFGVMGHAGIPLDSGTAMIAAIAIGLAVDDTLHFMVRYNRELRTTKDHSQAIERTLRSEARPILATSVSLALGFAVLAGSSFTPVVYFGLLSAMVMVLALLADFFVTPLALSTLSLITVWDLLSVRIRRQVMEGCELFRGMRPWQVKKFILSSEVRHYKKGEYIYRAGDASTELYILLEGDVEICLAREDGSRESLSRYQLGGLFGEIALLSRMPRPADAIAREDTELLALNWDAIRDVARWYPGISSRLFLNLSSLMGRRIAGRVLARRSQEA